MTTTVTSRRHLIMEVTGGLGNQLFQYAAARSLALSQGADLLLDTSFYDRGRHRTFELDRFPIRADIVGQKPQARWLRPLKTLSNKLFRLDQPSYHEPHFTFDPGFVQLTAPQRLTGYFQSPRYFESHVEQVHAELTPPAPQDAESQRLAEILQQPNSISLHVRRGDYVNNPKASATYHECSPDYYTRALQRLPEGAIVVFSDDPAWVQTQLNVGRPLHIASADLARSAIADLWLMTQAQHHIIANSTFSWWGAWLSSRPGTTIAPKNWFRSSEYSTCDLLPEHWIQV